MIADNKPAGREDRSSAGMVAVADREYSRAGELAAVEEAGVADPMSQNYSLLLILDLLRRYHLDYLLGP